MEINVEGGAGQGRVVIPVNAVATAVLPMPRGLGALLATLGGGLVLLAAAIAGAAVRESVLVPGDAPSARRIWAARAMAGASLVAIIGLLWFGRAWWESEARDYRSNRLYRPVDTVAEIEATETGSRILRLKYALDLMRRNGPLVPDHGKLMHLFLVREPGLDVFAHLHPRKLDWQRFEAALPELPAGDYRLYADITYETGLADTLTTRVSIPAARQVRSDLDPDDAWTVAGELNNANLPSRASLPGGYYMARLEVDTLSANRESRLRFGVFDHDANAVPLEDYMGMRGHLIIQREDGAVFTHLHPSGSFSMAAQQLFAMRLDGRAPLKVASYTNDPLCRLPAFYGPGSPPALQAVNEVAFPYSFPRPGLYRLWVQTRVRGKVVTGVFDVQVQGADMARR